MAGAQEMIGGAVKSEVAVSPATPEVTAEEGINVIVTAPGTFHRGILKPGKKMRVKFQHFSPNWMKPATAADTRKLETWQKKQAADKAEAAKKQDGD